MDTVEAITLASAALALLGLVGCGLGVLLLLRRAEGKRGTSPLLVGLVLLALAGAAWVNRDRLRPLFEGGHRPGAQP